MICVQMRVMRGSQEKIFEIILIVYRENFYRRLTKQNEAYQHKEDIAQYKRARRGKQRKIFEIIHWYIEKIFTEV